MKNDYISAEFYKIGGDLFCDISSCFLEAKEYKIKYYSPYDQVNSIKEETRFGSQHILEFPDMDTLDIILFEVFPMGENFKSMSNDSTNTEDITSRKPKKEYEDEVKVYPNPNDGNFVVLIEEPSSVKAICITDNLGKRIDTRIDIIKENYYNKSSFNSGVYYVEVILNSHVIRRKIIIK